MSSGELCARPPAHISVPFEFRGLDILRIRYLSYLSTTPVLCISWPRPFCLVRGGQMTAGSLLAAGSSLGLSV